LSGRGLCDELITRPEESYRLCCVVVCDLETSRMGAPYIYDISRLKVNDLTLILLTWRKWWAPNNASKQHMGFNSGFKGLIPFIAYWILFFPWGRTYRHTGLQTYVRIFFFHPDASQNTHNAAHHYVLGFSIYPLYFITTHGRENNRIQNSCREKANKGFYQTETVPT